jgi:hypothetical protein
MISTRNMKKNVAKKIEEKKRGGEKSNRSPGTCVLLYEIYCNTPAMSTWYALVAIIPIVSFNKKVFSIIELRMKITF